MRETKFRGKRIDNDEWVYGYLAADDKIMVWDNRDIGKMLSVHPETVGQFTCLPDKNGTEIYGGDVFDPMTEYSCRMTVVRDEIGNWALKKLNGKACAYVWGKWITEEEVIGTIHDKE